VLYRDRNAIERMFCRLKDFRRIATRYDRLATNYMAALCIATRQLLVMSPHHRPRPTWRGRRARICLHYLMNLGGGGGDGTSSHLSSKLQQFYFVILRTIKPEGVI
jgi:hypothetical protein